MSRNKSTSNSNTLSLSDGYFQRSQRPLQVLIFLLPLIIIYEVVTYLITASHDGHTQHILARSILDDLLLIFGAGGYFLPGVAVVVVLLSWHVVSRDPWKLRPSMYLGMALESIVMAIPLLMLGLIWAGMPSAQAVGQSVTEQSLEISWSQRLVLDIGAGIYEELFFRLLIIALAHFLLVDVLGMKHQHGAVLAVVTSAALFSAYHFFGEDTDGHQTPFSLPKAVFYFMAGLYFASVYLLRGFGIVVGTHAMYDIIITLMRQIDHSE